MSKKKDKSNDWLWNKIDVQAWRLKDLISTFYPGGVRVEFEEATQVGQAMMDSPARKCFSEDEFAKAVCVSIIKNAKVRAIECIDVDFFCNALWFQGVHCIDYNARIMFKVNPDDAPVYVREGWSDGHPAIRFLVDNDLDEAYLVLEDFEAKDKEIEFEGKISSFIRLSEFHAIIKGYDFDGMCDYSQKGDVCIMVSFSNERSIFENIYGFNESLLDQIFPPVEPGAVDNETPSSASDEDDETATGEETKV